MKLAIMQPYFFPYIGYWQLIQAVDRFVIYDDVNYIKGGWINRNRVLINGEPNFITVPLHHSSSYKHICDISLHASPNWRDKLLKSIENTYRKSSCFAEAFPVIENIIRHEADSLSDYLAYQLQTLATFMGLKTEFVVTSRHYGNDSLAGQARILDICKREGATTYINPQNGLALYDREDFSQQGVNLKFLMPVAIEYKQFGSTYVPWLSIIDVMMFNSTSQLDRLLTRYELV